MKKIGNGELVNGEFLMEEYLYYPDWNERNTVTNQALAGLQTALGYRTVKLFAKILCESRVP